ncbi:hypothetical protein [Cryobacterium soli]|jgi:hypothetical protein|uniref:hypothetical protein n=1 Tax=Cryobacterium soli TaxID=2220095 RepID=UPI0013C4D39B|nr:hypothetical protein [Cryobacterium soli]
MGWIRGDLPQRRNRCADGFRPAAVRKADWSARAWGTSCLLFIPSDDLYPSLCRLVAVEEGEDND